jgi:GNAT superfamily N-acetyltransferase
VNDARSRRELTTEILAGAAIAAVIADLARLRVAVFREFPYLYDGDLDDERTHLRKYADLEESTVVVARDASEGAAGRVVGASTALPLARGEPALQAPFRATGIPVGQVYYFGESVLEPSYRGRGLGHAFFDGRESRARALGYSLAAFCAVERPADHPLRPPGYRPLDGFWAKRRYVRRPDLRAHFTWRDVNESTASPKPMVFWLRQL